MGSNQRALWRLAVQQRRQPDGPAGHGPCVRSTARARPSRGLRRSLGGDGPKRDIEMRRSKSVTEVLMLFAIFLASRASAQYGSLGVYADPGATHAPSPCLLDDQPTIRSYYIVHEAIWDGAVACQFSAPKPDCFTGTYLSDTVVWYEGTYGNSQTGVIVAYGICARPIVHVLTMNFLCYGTTPACCCYPVRPDPAETSKKILVLDCWDNIRTVSSNTNVINWNPACSEGCWICPYSVPTQTTTWGEIKALYGE
jgi:hypothetical protein